MLGDERLVASFEIRGGLCAERVKRGERRLTGDRLGDDTLGVEERDARGGKRDALELLGRCGDSESDDSAGGRDDGASHEVDSLHG